MSVIRTAGKTLLIILLIPIVLPLLIISIIGLIVDIPFARRRRRQIAELPERLFLPNGKYAYIQYTTGGPLSDWIKEEIIDKYESRLVVDCWNQEKHNWEEPSWEKIDKKTGRLLVGELSPDCEGLSCFFVVGIDPKTKLFDTEKELYLFGPPYGEWYTVKDEDEERSEADVKRFIKEYMKGLLA